MNEFSKNLKSLRKQNSLTQAEMGQRLGVTGSSIAMYEREERLPSTPILEKTANYFGVSIDYLLGQEQTSEYLTAETKELVRFLRHNPDYRPVINALTKVDKGDLPFIIKIIESLK